jgi:hypothetical protein
MGALRYGSYFRADKVTILPKRDPYRNVIIRLGSDVLICGDHELELCKIAYRTPQWLPLIYQRALDLFDIRNVEKPESK